MRLIKCEKYRHFDDFERACSRGKAGERIIIYYIQNTGIISGNEEQSATGEKTLVCMSFSNNPAEMGEMERFLSKSTRSQAQHDAAKSALRIIGEADVSETEVQAFIDAYANCSEQYADAMGNADSIDEEAQKRANLGEGEINVLAAEVFSRRHPNYDSALNARDRTLAVLINREFKYS